MFRFAFEPALWGLVLVPILAAFLAAAYRRRRLVLERFGNLRLIERLSPTVSPGRRVVKRALLLAALGLLVAALARPQFGSRVETVRRRGQDIVVALDVSRSMLAEDMAPNRLERAKLAVRRLIDRLDGDRIGLVAFAGDAFVQCPLTIDYGAAAMFLNAMAPDLIPVQGTDLGKAVTVALDALEGESRHQFIVVISDGEDHEGAVDRAVQRAAERGVRIHTVGIGSADGVPVPAFDAEGRRRGFQRDADGNVVTTRLDAGPLRRIADATGGRYLTARDADALGGFADEMGMEGPETAAQQVTLFEEQYRIFLGMALVLLLAEILVAERRREPPGTGTAA